MNCIASWEWSPRLENSSSSKERWVFQKNALNKINGSKAVPSKMPLTALKRSCHPLLCWHCMIPIKNWNFWEMCHIWAGGNASVKTRGERERPVACVSKSLTETQQCYAQVEKKALAWSDVGNGLKTTLLWNISISRQTTNPLVRPLEVWALDELPQLILRFWMRFMKYS